MTAPELPPELREALEGWQIGTPERIREAVEGALRALANEGGWVHEPYPPLTAAVLRALSGLRWESAVEAARLLAALERLDASRFAAGSYRSAAGKLAVALRAAGVEPAP